MFKRPRQPSKPSRPKQNQPYMSKTQSQSFTSSTRKDFPKRSSNSKQFPSSKHAPSSTKFWKPTLSTACLTTPRYSSGGKIGPLCGTMGKINKQQMGPIVRNGFRIPFRLIPPLSSVPIKLSQSSFMLLREEIGNLLQKQAVERVQDLGTPGFYSLLFHVQKKNGKFSPVIDFSILNQYIKKQPFKMETVKSVRQSILVNVGCLHRPDRCLSSCSNSFAIHEVASVHLRRSGLPVHSLTFRNVPKSVDFHQTNGYNSSAPASTWYHIISVPRRLAD